MDSMDMLHSHMQEEEDFPPVTPADLSPFAAYFDDRDFAVGTYVQKRSDGADITKGGVINYKHPRKGEPALVVGHCEPPPIEGGTPYDRETLVILVKGRKGRIIRIAVDPVHFERYELPGERMLREIEEGR